MLFLEGFGGGVNVADNTPALDRLAEYASTRWERKVKLDGLYKFQTKPKPLTVGLRFIGESISISGLRRDYSATSPGEKFLEWTNKANGGGFEHIGIAAGPGTTGGTMVCVAAPGQGLGADYCRMNDFVITYSDGASYSRALFIDGVANNLNGGQGVRSLRISGGSIFAPPGSATYQIEIRNAVSMFVRDTWTNCSVLLSGGGTQLTNSVKVKMSGVDIDGAFYLENCASVSCAAMEVGGSLTVTASVSGGRFDGVVYGGVANASPTFRVTTQ